MARAFPHRAARTAIAGRRVCCVPRYKMERRSDRRRIMVRNTGNTSPSGKPHRRLFAQLGASNHLAVAVPELPGLTALPGRVHALAVTTETRRRKPALDGETEERFFTGAAEATSFFMGESDVHHALEQLPGLLEADGIPDAILGGMALN